MPEPNACLVCARPDVAEIDAALDASEGLNATARRFDLSRGAVQRHAKHRDAKPAKAPEAPPASASPASSPRAPAPPPPPAEPPPLSEPAARRTRTGKGGQCACCASPKRGEIDRLLFEGAAYLAIEARVAPGPSHDSIRRHAQGCVRGLLEERREGRTGDLATEMRERLEALLERAERLVDEAEGGEVLCARCGEEAGAASPRDRAATITAAKGVFELLARILGMIRTEVDLRVIMASPHVVLLLEAIRRGLKPHPEARAAVAAELEALEQRQAPRLVGGP